MSSIFYSFSQSNQTSSPVLCDKTEQRKDIILNKCSDYSLSIVKFNLPSTEIETFIIDSVTDYVITYSCCLNNSTNTGYITPTASQSMYLSSAQKMKSIQDWIENWNRTSLLCYKNLLDACDATCNNVISLSASGTSTNLGTVSQVDFNFDFTAQIPSTDAFVSYVTLNSNIFNASNTQLYEVHVIDPNGITCIVSSNKKRSSSGAILFEDGSLNAQHNVTDHILSANNYQPIEPFIKFAQSTASQKGVWKVRVINKNTSSTPAFTFSHSNTLTLYLAPRGGTNQEFFPRLPVALGLDSAGTSLKLNYDDNLPRSSFQIGVSPRLYEVMSFPGTFDGSKYILKLPQTPIANTGSMSFIPYPQPLPCAYKLIDITEVQIRSQDLPVLGEWNVQTKERIVSSIDVSTSDLNNSNYQYVNVQEYYRSYDLVSDLTLDKINIQVFVRYRSTNIVKPVFLPAYTTFNLTLQFKKKTN
jgi:hypothetical protein